MWHKAWRTYQSGKNKIVIPSQPCSRDLASRDSEADNYPGEEDNDAVRDKMGLDHWQGGHHIVDDCCHLFFCKEAECYSLTGSWKDTKPSKSLTKRPSDHSPHAAPQSEDHQQLLMRKSSPVGIATALPLANLGIPSHPSASSDPLETLPCGRPAPIYISTSYLGITEGPIRCRKSTLYFKLPKALRGAETTPVLAMQSAISSCLPPFSQPWGRRLCLQPA